MSKVNKYSNIRTLKELDLQISLLHKESARTNDRFRRDIRYAMWYYSPVRIVNEFSSGLKSSLVNFFFNKKK